MATANLTRERLRELLHYDPETGLFTWLVGRKGPGAKAGKTAGHVHSIGYVFIGVDGKRYLAHRLAFLYMDGAMPPVVDHINGAKNDNRWCNLREATSQTNAQNIRRAHRANSSGLLGVSRTTVNKSKPWVAQIKPPGSDTVNLGYFATPEEAHAAYLKAKRELHEGCTI